jgi:hypothetical protein
MSFIAKEALFVGNARAHNPGDHVPEDNIARNGWQDQVAKVGTKAAEQVIAEQANAVSGDQEGIPTTAQTPPAGQGAGTK